MDSPRGPAPGRNLLFRDVVLVGLLTAAAVYVRLTVSWYLSPAITVPIGPDADDWAGVLAGATASWSPSWPPSMSWDGEWSYKYPLLPVLAVFGARTLDVPPALAAWMATALAGSLLPALTYGVGVAAVGRGAALAAAGWMVVQDGLVSHAVLTTSYAFVPPLYLGLVLGACWLEEGRRSRGLLAMGGCAALLTFDLLHGALLVGTALAAGVAAARPWRRDGRRLVAWLVGSTGLGVLLGRLALVPFGPGRESPFSGGLRHLYEEVAQTVFHDPRFGVPTGHQVERLVRGMSRPDHAALTSWEYFNLPLVGVVLACAVGLVVFGVRRHEPGAFGRRLLAWLLPGVVYAFVANSEDFHVFQWFPPLALVVAAGAIGWTACGSARWLARWPVQRVGPVLGVALALGFLAWQAIVVRQVPGLDPARRYLRVDASWRESAAMVTACRAMAAPFTVRGMLVVDEPFLWGNRGFLPQGMAAVSTRDLQVPGPDAGPVGVVSRRSQGEVEALLGGAPAVPLLAVPGQPGVTLWRRVEVPLPDDLAPGSL